MDWRPRNHSPLNDHRDVTEFKMNLNVHQGHKSSSSKLHQLSDTWEFQEKEIMNAKARLRSIRGELAVLEGKMTLSIKYALSMFIFYFYFFKINRCNTMYL